MTLAVAAPLGDIVSYASAPDDVGAKKGRANRWALQDAAAELLPNEGVAWCCRHIVQGKSGVGVALNPKTKAAHYQNLMHCNSVWNCPICATKISGGRRVELTQAASCWNGAKLLITLTLQHERGDSLIELRDALNDGFRKLKSGRWFQIFEDEFGVSASVASHETTWGDANGWHPHKHVMLFSSIPEADFDLEGFKSRLIERYTSILARSGHYASDLYGVDVRLGDEQIGDYVAKWGMIDEVTKSSVKNGRGGYSYSPFELLGLYLAGEKWAGPLYVEYAHAMKGRRQLVWSKGGRKAVGLGVEQIDAELVSEEESEGESETLITLNYEQFKQVWMQGKRGRLLEVACKGDIWSLWDFLERECGVFPTWLQRVQREGVIFGRGP